MVADPDPIPALIERLRTEAGPLHLAANPAMWDIGDLLTKAADALAALTAQLHEVTERRSELLVAARFVVDTFTKDEAQGYRSKDRQFAIEILGRAAERSL